MNEMFASPVATVLVLVLSALAGAALGTLFFGGLWWTARRGAVSSQPALWFFVSLFLRMSIALLGFYAVSDGRWERMLTCLLGFVVARAAVMRLTRPQDCAPASQEAEHAP
ncbi:ATP synthase subunit I [Variovorax ureilyticus]|uniref:ATP synthase subunit I n=1 Tax=Variovorax ureilyticus TaxID=1836198 RepID=A0ABU8VLB1_9BURK